MTPANHIVHYKGCTIIYDNGVYKIKELPTFPFLSMTEAKKEVDKHYKEDLFHQNELNADNKKTIL
jgi:hypothetical protein